MKHVGIGFRRDIAQDIIDLKPEKRPSFIEVAPENWMNMGGYWKSIFDQAAEQYQINCHGLSLSIGSPDELNKSFVHEVKDFIDQYNISIYSEHLSYSQCDNAHLYDLLPIPFRKDAIDHIVDRIKIVQDIIGKPITLENVSYYTPLAAEMGEAEFISEIIERSGCNMLLDVNNVYVNAFNHQYDAQTFIKSLPLDKVAYMHMAGHKKVSEDLIIDTHGSPIIDPVFDLFEWTIQYLKPMPVLLERDFNIPELPELLEEANHLESICTKQWDLTAA
jgi:uncharacterized protein (UPF0276 family)